MEINIIQELKKLVISVNESLQYYEKDFISVQRCPILPRERVDTLRQYIECRFNFEAFKSEIFRPYAEYFDGRLFEVTSVIGADEKKRKFSEVCIELCKDAADFANPGYLEEDEFKETTYFSVIEAVREILGGSRIYFNHSQKIPKIRIEL